MLSVLRLPLAVLAVATLAAFSPQGSEETALESEALAPYFGPTAPVPEAPALTAFDARVLELCGAWGDHPERGDFKGLLYRSPEDESMIRALVGGSLRGEKPFREELADIWFNADGFVHTFCGEPGVESLGGPHFVGRYIQAQEEGWMGAIDAETCPRNEVNPPVYTIGSRYLTPAGHYATKCPNGFALDQSARRLLAEAALAVKQAEGWNRPGRHFCTIEVGPPEHRYSLLVVMDDGALRTAYPLAEDQGRAPPCAAP